MKRVLVIGAGAAGMMAAITAAKLGAKVTILEKNEKPGKKLYITGKGRCNLLNQCERDDFLAKVQRNSRFLYSSYDEFDAKKTLSFFHEQGLSTKTERGNRVFPSSDKSSDVIRTLENSLKSYGVEIHYHTVVKNICIANGKACGCETVDKKQFLADAVVVATGGLSYPSTGSTGDGYRFAKEAGHKINPCFPSLVSIHLKDREGKCIWSNRSLEGLSLKNVTLSVTIPVEKKSKTVEKELYQGFGEMLFTANGISGPLGLSASSALSGMEADKANVWIDLKPALSMEQLEQRILLDFQENINRQFRNSLHALLPIRMAEYIISISEIDPYKKVNSITQTERRRLCERIKKLSFSVSGLGSFQEAVITRGGVEVKEIVPQTMESKLVSGLFFAGEVMDLDALTGGYNLQIAWTTGHAAGVAAALEEE